MRSSTAGFLLLLACPVTGCASNPFAQVAVPAAEVLAHPELYHQRTIEIRGVIELKPFAYGIYATKEACEAGDGDQAISLRILNHDTRGRWFKCGEGWAVGGFNMHGSGHMGFGKGELENLGSFGQFKGQP
jgi:hypothetical protein